MLTEQEQLDFGKPGPVGRDPLTEAWNPTPLPLTVALILTFLCDLVPFALVALLLWLACHS